MPYKNKDYAKKRRQELYAEKRETILERAQEYRANNREKINESNKKRYHEKYRADRLANYDPQKRAADHQAKKEKENKQALERYRSLRDDVYSHYGNKCAFCGDSNIRHLSIDHINNDGAKHRREGFRATKLLRWLKNNNYPEGFQLLCFTHNFEKGHYGTMTQMEFDNA